MEPDNLHQANTFMFVLIVCICIVFFPFLLLVTFGRSKQGSVRGVPDELTEVAERLAAPPELRGQRGGGGVAQQVGQR